MCITKRYYQLADQCCVTYLPVKPSGFGILLLGDRNHYVEGDTSFWNEHIGWSNLLEDLQEEGYTIFSSNLFGSSFGNEAAYDLAILQYTHLMKNEILNEQIHIIAEGTGVLTAFELMKKNRDLIRSVVFISPCLDLFDYIHREQKRKFFYKRLMNELKAAYELAEEQILSFSKVKSFVQDETNIPVKIYAVTTSYERECCDLYKEQKMQNAGELEVTYFVKERKYQIAKSISLFLSQYESEL
ncbi:MAG: alpha/beta hydrolase [Bacillaceae bacterium]